MLLGARTAGPRFPRIALSWYGAFGKNFGATIGDLLAVEGLSRALTRSRIAHAVISAFPTSLSVPIVEDYRRMPAMDMVVQVCGPIIPIKELRFILLQARRRIAVGVSVLPNHAEFNKTFDAIVARDGQEPETFDLAPANFAGSLPMPPADRGGPPIVGLCLRGKQSEYGSREIFHDKALALFGEAARRRSAALHEIDTVFRPANMSAKIVADFRHVDIVATTRMHGALLGLCAGKPVIAVDQVQGGAKVTAMLKKIGWPLAFAGENVTRDAIEDAFARALSPDIRPLVERCRAEAIRLSAEAVDLSVAGIKALSVGVPAGR